MTTTAQDVVGVFDSGHAQLFENARPIEALVKVAAKFMEHPVESGATITDHIVYLPNEIELQMILDPEDYAATYQQIKTAYLAATELTVLTKADTYTGLRIMALPRKETAEMFDTVAVSIRLREVQIVDAQYAQLPAAKVKNKKHSSTVKTGQKQPAAPTAPQSSAAFDLFGLGG